jgi:hemerythrin-like metal-binding protein
MIAGDVMLLKWQEMFSVGHRQLDAEHRRLLDIINAIHAAETAGALIQTTRLLNDFHVNAMEHFRHENALICEIIAGAYPGREGCMSEAIANEHRAEHARALIALESLVRLHALGREKDLALHLMNWFVGHATDQDAQLRTYFQPAQPAARVPLKPA